jgi:hypothetical protein
LAKIGLKLEISNAETAKTLNAFFNEEKGGNISLKMPKKPLRNICVIQLFFCLDFRTILFTL